MRAQMAQRMIDEDDNESPATGDDDHSIDLPVEDEPPSRLNGAPRA